MAKNDNSVDAEKKSTSDETVLENNEAASDVSTPEITLQEAIVDAVASLLLAVSGQLRSSNSELAADLLEKRQILLKALEPASKEK